MSNKSYLNFLTLGVLEGTKEKLTLTKLNFFGYIASLLQKILLTYQTDALMIPFLFEDLFSTAKSLMSLIIKQDVLNRIINARQLQKFDFSKKENFLPLKLMTIGFAAECNMELRRKDVLSQDVINRFMKDCSLTITGV